MQKFNILLKNAVASLQTNPNILLQIQEERNTLPGFVKDDTVSFMVSQLKDTFDDLMHTFPVEGITFNQYLNDLKSLSNTNPYAPVLVKSTDQYLSFRRTNSAPVDKTNIDAALPALKQYADFVKQQTTGLRSTTIQDVYLESSTSPKIVDISSLWYARHTNNVRNAAHLNIFPIQLDPSTMKLYILGEIPAELTNDFPQRAAELGVTFTVEVV